MTFIKFNFRQDFYTVIALKLNVEIICNLSFWSAAKQALDERKMKHKTGESINISVINTWISKMDLFI